MDLRELYKGLESEIEELELEMKNYKSDTKLDDLENLWDEFEIKLTELKRQKYDLEKQLMKASKELSSFNESFINKFYYSITGKKQAIIKKEENELMVVKREHELFGT